MEACRGRLGLLAECRGELARCSSLDMSKFRKAQSQHSCSIDTIAVTPNQAAGNVVLSSHYASAAGVSPLDSLFTDASFKDMIRSALPYLISEDDARVVIKYLVRDRRLAVARDGVIKLARSEAEVNAVEPITEDDKGLLAVKETHAKLEKQIEQIEQRVRE